MLVNLRQLPATITKYRNSTRPGSSNCATDQKQPRMKQRGGILILSFFKLDNQATLFPPQEQFPANGAELLGQVGESVWNVSILCDFFSFLRVKTIRRAWLRNQTTDESWGKSPGSRVRPSCSISACTLSCWPNNSERIRVCWSFRAV